MDKRERRANFVFWGTLGLLVAMIAFIAIRPKRASVQDIGVDQRLGKVLPLATKFKDEDGKDVLFGDYFHKGRPVILVPLFYRCKSACTLLTDGVLESMVDLRALNAGRDYDTVMFSILPTEGPVDATARKKYAVEHYTANPRYPRPGAANGIHCLTGTADSINQLCKTLGFTYKLTPKGDDVLKHPTAIMICSPDGLLSKYFYGVDFPAVLVKKGLQTAQSEKIAELSEPKFFGCWNFDPSRGVYVLRAEQFLKIIGTSFALLTFASLIYMGKRFKPPTVLDSEIQEGS